MAEVINRASQEQIARSNGDLFDELESGALDPEGEEVDMLAEACRYLDILRAKPFCHFEDDDKRKALLAFQKATQMVLKEARLVVSTNNNTGDKIISSNFGAGASGIVAIQDVSHRGQSTSNYRSSAATLLLSPLTSLRSSRYTPPFLYLCNYLSISHRGIVSGKKEAYMWL